MSLATAFSTIHGRSRDSSYGSHFSKIIERGFDGGVGKRSTITCRGGGGGGGTSRSIIVGSLRFRIDGGRSRIINGGGVGGRGGICRMTIGG
mgnify:CR=1 FL=1